MPEESLNRLALELFKTFSRMEYSLKAAGFHCGEGDAKADWTGFALTIEALLSNPNTEELREAIKHLLHNPPKKQIVKNGLLVWSDKPPNAKSNADLILLYVRRVRNNLFHGGKFNGHWFAPERSRELLRSSLIILKACLESAPQVAAAYNSK
jgi:hypothetical protein